MGWRGKGNDGGREWGGGRKGGWHRGMKGGGGRVGLREKVREARLEGEREWY